MTKILPTLLAFLALTVFTAGTVSAQDLNATRTPPAGAYAGPESDPLEGYNRFMFMMNDFFDVWLLEPAAKSYKYVVPRQGRNGVRNFIDNLMEPLTFVNEILQGEGTKAGQTVFRFTVNTIGGVGGIFNVADDIGYERRQEDFGQTLAVWGVPAGPYVVLPLLGPSNVRDTVGFAGDIFLNPVYWVAEEHDQEDWAVAGNVLSIIDHRSRNIERVQNIKEDSLDYYATVRSLYKQNRQAEIENRNDPKINFDTLPSYEFE